jgi:hypothetical protein
LQCRQQLLLPLAEQTAFVPGWCAELYCGSLLHRFKAFPDARSWDRSSFVTLLTDSVLASWMLGDTAGLQQYYTALS